MLQPDRLYVIDGGYFQYELLARILAANSSFVARVQPQIAHKCKKFASFRPQPARQALPATPSCRPSAASTACRSFTGPVRLVVVDTVDRHGHPLQLFLLTDRLDLPAELVALAYRHRWSIELFFRWMKSVLKARHLIAHSANGVALQMYAALIVSLLLGAVHGPQTESAVVRNTSVLSARLGQRRRTRRDTSLPAATRTCLNHAIPPELTRLAVALDAAPNRPHPSAVTPATSQPTTKLPTLRHPHTPLNNPVPNRIAPPRGGNRTKPGRLARDYRAYARGRLWVVRARFGSSREEKGAGPEDDYVSGHPREGYRKLIIWVVSRGGGRKKVGAVASRDYLRHLCLGESGSPGLV